MEKRFTRRDFLTVSELGLAGTGLTMTLVPPGASAAQGSQTSSQPSAQTSTNATYYNNAFFNAADPYALYDERSGY